MAAADRIFFARGRSRDFLRRSTNCLLTVKDRPNGRSLEGSTLEPVDRLMMPVLYHGDQELSSIFLQNYKKNFTKL